IARAGFHGRGGRGFIHLRLHEHDRWRRLAPTDGLDDGRRRTAAILGEAENEFRGPGLQRFFQGRGVGDPDAMNRMAGMTQYGIDRGRVLVAAGDDDQRNSDGVAQSLHPYVDLPGWALWPAMPGDYVTVVRYTGLQRAGGPMSSSDSWRGSCGRPVTGSFAGAPGRSRTRRGTR